LGILTGSLLGVAITVIIVFASGKGSATDGTSWAWLDVVRPTEDSSSEER